VTCLRTRACDPVRSLEGCCGVRQDRHGVSPARNAHQARRDDEVLRDGEVFRDARARHSAVQVLHDACQDHDEDHLSAHDDRGEGHCVSVGEESYAGVVQTWQIPSLPVADGGDGNVDGVDDALPGDGFLGDSGGACVLGNEEGDDVRYNALRRGLNQEDLDGDAGGGDGDDDMRARALRVGDDGEDGARQEFRETR
jgi:hypothetical protein